MPSYSPASMDLAHLLAITTAILFGSPIPSAGPWIVPQPKANVWGTLASAIGQENICLNMASAEDPMSTCLVGIPLPPIQIPYPVGPPLTALTTKPISSSVDPRFVWRDAIKNLAPLDSEPSQLELLGSANASFCFQFVYSPIPGDKRFESMRQFKKEYTASQWCDSVAQLYTPSTYGSQPLSLPRGIFFICGDRVWAGIPSRLVGGPCTIGWLSLFTPNLMKINDWKVKRTTPDLVRSKRDIKELDLECDSEIIHWSKPKIVAVTLFLPWVSVAKSLGELARLECWVAKQANLTSATLSDLLADEETTRKATLQNRAAIDFLLLLHNHRCEEFEGLCCLNLTSRAEDVRVTIDKMKGLVHDIKQQTSDWLGDLFQVWGLSGWAGSILKTVFIALLVLFVVLVACSIVWGLVKRLIARTIASPDVNRVEVPGQIGEDWNSTSSEHSNSEDFCPDFGEVEQAQTSV
ncbi:uncharacterized protein LOC118699418 [Molothrus ater]|uniref:uncharacterized protein LOC118699418 n=1 Tax=Molothrus ater TaxID=84834 RepID=UPI00174BBA60|nr:uncharacterized protein LOC118699418 [Molothrus ater]